MSVYHIQLRTADHVHKALSVEMADHNLLRIEMARFVGAFLRDHAEKIWADQEWRVDVTDEAGLILYVLELQVTDTPATMTRPR